MRPGTWDLGLGAATSQLEVEREVTAGGCWAHSVSTAHISLRLDWAPAAGLQTVWALKVRVNINLETENWHSEERSK